MIFCEAIFGMDLLHSTLPNGRQAFRLSCDTRWQPLDEEPPQGVQTGPWRARQQGLPEGRRSRKGRMNQKMDDQICGKIAMFLTLGMGTGAVSLGVFLLLLNF